MRLLHLILVSAVLMIFPLLAGCSGNSVSAAAVDAIGQKINCTCGCELTVINCDSAAGQRCETAQKEVKLIQKGLAAGQPEEQIIRNIEGIYGQRAIIQQAH